jgi:4-hydroxy-4-methyl-2-oxoglutarate aldolase
MIRPDILDPALTTRLDIERVTAETAAAAGKLPTATLHEAGGKIGVLPPAIKPVAQGMRLSGPAVTVHSPGGDNLWLHRGIYAAQPGDVLVVSVSEAYAHGYWGEIMSTAAKVRGLAGLVIDGCVRDVNLLTEIGFPVFARGLCIRGTGKDFGARGWINATMRLDGEIVHPGDLIVGDADGVVCLPLERAAVIVSASIEREDYEAGILKRIEAGEDTLSIYGWNRG